MSGEEIYAKAVVDATGPDGARLIAVRGHGHAGGVLYKRLAIVDSWSGAGVVTAT